MCAMICGMDNEPEYTVAEACAKLGGISRSTLDRWAPPGTEGRRVSRAPGTPRVRLSQRLVMRLAEELTDERLAESAE